jgi:catechol 2,3-dioxygenase-like lactoylglutathione lyase family enzyme
MNEAGSIQQNKEQDMQNSDVQFATRSRVHISLATDNIEASRRFYRTVFGVEPTKVKPGYARFEVADPPVNFSLIAADEQTGPTQTVSHFGIQLKSTEEVVAIRERLQSAGLPVIVEEGVTCCHAVQDKFWITDPNSNRWEFFVVTDDAPVDERNNNDGECCADTEQECCTGDKEACC